MMQELKTSQCGAAAKRHQNMVTNEASRRLDEDKCPLYASEIAPPQGEQPLPVPLGRSLVVGGTLRKREAVLDLGIKLDFRIQTFQSGAQRFDLLHRHPAIDLGAGEVEFGACRLVRHPMRTI